MDENLIIQLGSSKNVNAVNVDQYIDLQLNSSPKEILSYNESSVIDVADLFDTERQESEAYRVYGRVDFLSVMNGLKKQYKTLTDFFTPPRLGDELSGLTKNIINSFDIYLCYPASTNTYLSGDTANTATYVRDYVIASKLVNGEIYKSGYARNVYFNYTYAFDFNIDFNIESYLDSFGKPFNEFYLYFVYKKTVNGENPASRAETFKRRNWSGGDLDVIYNSTTGYSVGTIISGDRVTYNKLNFLEELNSRITYYITTPYDATKELKFKYNPFIPIKIRDYGDELVTANITGGTENDFNIPSYATPIDSKGNYVWKDILPNGYIDPITNLGVDYPFVNKRHYLFSTVTLPVVPDLTHSNTLSVFQNIKFGPNTTINTKPNSSLNSLGNRCA